jgi:conjugative transfer region protein (TIGR03750 family)
MDRLCTRLDAEPPTFRGCTTSGLGLLLLLAISGWLPLRFVLAGLLGRLPLDVGLAAVGVVVTVLVVTMLWQCLKRDRPDGYYRHWVLLYLHRRGWWRSPFLQRQGGWDLGRQG